MALLVTTRVLDRVLGCNQQESEIQLLKPLALDETLLGNPLPHPASLAHDTFTGRSDEETLIRETGYSFTWADHPSTLVPN